jgi:uncharacterized membrane protein
MFYTSIKILAIVGIILALYLFIEQVFQPPFRPCHINETINCEPIISGSLQKILGISTPLYGLTGYILIFMAAFFQMKKTLVGVAAAGLIFCLGIAYEELVVLHVICPVCMGCQFVMISIFSIAMSLLSIKKG